MSEDPTGVVLGFLLIFSLVSWLAYSVAAAKGPKQAAKETVIVMVALLMIYLFLIWYGSFR